VEFNLVNLLLFFERGKFNTLEEIVETPCLIL
jgi:hypothetical protein